MVTHRGVSFTIGHPRLEQRQWYRSDSLEIARPCFMPEVWNVVLSRHHTLLLRSGFSCETTVAATVGCSCGFDKLG